MAQGPMHKGTAESTPPAAKDAGVFANKQKNSRVIRKGPQKTL